MADRSASDFVRGVPSLGQPIVHFEIIGKDTNKAKKFYGDLFGCKIGDVLGPETDNYALVDGESSGVAGGLGEGQNGETRVTVYAQVPDPQATLDKATQMGGKVLMPPTEIPGGNVTLAMFADPDGNVIGLTKG